MNTPEPVRPTAVVFGRGDPTVYFVQLPDGRVIRCCSCVDAHEIARRYDAGLMSPDFLRVTAIETP